MTFARVPRRLPAALSVPAPTLTPKLPTLRETILLSCLLLSVLAAVPARAEIAVAPIVAGSYHTCALTRVGGVKCWGWNAYGQLGDGTTTTRRTAVDVTGLTSGVTAIAAEGAHTCVLTSAGGVKCWGNNPYGGLGDGTTTTRLTVVDVSGLTSGMTALAAGDYHTCALTGAGGVKCWGFNGNGQLGDATTTMRLTPVDVSGLASGITALAAGGGHTCALTSAGGVKCWGDNSFGQLGDGTTTQRLVAVDVSGLTSEVIALAADGLHTCALTSAGGVKCWGYNASGRLGDGTTTTRLTAVDVSGVTSGMTALAAGGAHTCALASAGGMKCWGYNADGELGDGTTTARLTAVDVTGLASGITALAAGGAHTCALTSTGSMKCWGYDGDGQLGDNGLFASSVPIEVLDFGPVCGNGIVEPTEPCDDGNAMSGDCCTPSCELESDPVCPIATRAAMGVLETQGSSVAATATRLAVGGAAFGGGQGAAYLFDETGALLCRFANPSPPSISTDLFGRKIAFLGNDVLVTAPHDDTYGMQNGIAYLFDGTTCELVRTFHKPSPGIQEHFGSGLAVLPDGTFLVGAETDSTAAHFSGAIYRFDAAGTLLAAIPNPTGIAEETFGNAIAVVGSNVVVGASGATVSGSATAGKAYVLDGTTYALVRTLLSPNRTTGGRFGQSVAAHGSDVLVGAHTDTIGIARGAGYRFDIGTGQLVQTYVKPVPGLFDYCGYSVLSLGGTVALGCPHADGAFTDGGEVHLFDADTGLLLQTFLNPGASSGAEPGGFGWALAEMAGRLAIGAPGNDVLGVDSGAVYLVDPCGNGALNLDEACDDGNIAAGDCCTPTCQAEGEGAPCSDGDACTQTDTCQGGSCTGSDAVVCTASDQCHVAACNPATGECSDPAAPDGTTCDDGNTCTLDDVCSAGVCAGDSPVCGDGILQTGCGEECDDAGVVGDDGCDASCHFEPCPPQPRSGCRLPVVGGKAQLKIKDATDDTKDQLQWQWSAGEATAKLDYGNPLAADAYHLCIYDGGALRATTLIPPGGNCAGKSCWKESTKSFAYQDKELTPDGAAQLKLNQGDEGKAKVSFKGKGVLLDVPPLASLAGPVRVQLVRSGGAEEVCWEAVYSAPFLKNDGVSFVDKAD